LSINRSNRPARFGYRFRVLALCVCRSTFALTGPLISNSKIEKKLNLGHCVYSHIQNQSRDLGEEKGGSILHRHTVALI
jgi:hypothetical protein